MRSSAEGPDPAFRRVVTRLLQADDETLTFTPVAGGVSSDLWRVRHGPVSYCAKRALPRLKVARRWEAPVSRNAEEVRWLRTVRPWVGERVAEVVAADENAGVALLAWYDPACWHPWKSELLAGRVDGTCAAHLGALLGNIAREAADVPELAESFANAPLFDALRIDPFFRCIVQRHPALRGTVAMLEREHRTLVHGDFSPKNVLVDAAGEVRVLDAECACWGHPAFDPGYLLAHLLLKCLHTGNDALLSAAHGFWRAYASAAPTTHDLERDVAQIAGAMLVARVDGKSPVEYLTPDHAAQARRRGLELLQSPPPSVRDLLSAWP